MTVNTFIYNYMYICFLCCGERGPTTLIKGQQEIQTKDSNPWTPVVQGRWNIPQLTLYYHVLKCFIEFFLQISLINTNDEM